jgi:hypothetical protein
MNGNRQPRQTMKLAFSRSSPARGFKFIKNSSRKSNRWGERPREPFSSARFRGSPGVSPHHRAANILANLGSVPSHYRRNEFTVERLFVFRVLEISSATVGLGSGPLACNSALSDYRENWPTACLMESCMRIAFKNVNRSRRDGSPNARPARWIMSLPRNQSETLGVNFS